MLPFPGNPLHTPGAIIALWDRCQRYKRDGFYSEAVLKHREYSAKLTEFIHKKKAG